MVDDRITDGRRIAEVLASELEGREDDGLETITIENVDREVEPTSAGARAYDVARDGERLAGVFVREEGIHLAFECTDATVLEAATDAGLPVDRDGAVVTVETAASVKRAVGVVQAAIHSPTD